MMPQVKIQTWKIMMEYVLTRSFLYSIVPRLPLCVQDIIVQRIPKSFYLILPFSEEVWVHAGMI